MDAPRPTRRRNRLAAFSYSTPGAYFITICTKDRKNLFWQDVGATIGRPQKPALSKWGLIVDNAIRGIPEHYASVTVDRYAVMPNHVHLLLQIHTDSSGRPMVAPTISTVVQQFKGIVTKRIGCVVWQKLFHDHVIRNEADYRKIWEYIDANPQLWHKDCYYSE